MGPWDQIAWQSPRGKEWMSKIFEENSVLRLRCTLLTGYRGAGYLGPELLDFKDYLYYIVARTTYILGVENFSPLVIDKYGDGIFKRVKVPEIYFELYAQLRERYIGQKDLNYRKKLDYKLPFEMEVLCTHIEDYVRPRLDSIDRRLPGIGFEISEEKPLTDPIKLKALLERKIRFLRPPTS